VRWRDIGIVYRKELRDSLRDRRTLISMIVVPVVALPLLMLGMGVLAYTAMRKAAAETPEIMLLGGEDSPKTVAALRTNQSIRIIPTVADFTNQIVEKRVRAVVEIPRDFDAAIARGDAAVIRIYNYAGEVRSAFASENLDRFFRDLRNTTVRERLEARGISPQILKPFDIVQQNVAPATKVSGNVLGGLLPYLIFIMGMIGAIYPATDLTAGEKERGTMETVLCSPVSRTDLVLGKFFMILTASLATIVLSLSSMGGTFQFGKLLASRAVAKQAIELPLALDPVGIAGVLLMMLPVAVMLSAVLLAVSLYARSFREAQSYTGPLMIVVIMPALIGMLPGVDLDAKLALVPLVNVSLVCKELMAGTWHWPYLLLIFGSSCVYAAIALRWAVWLFQREEVLFRT
jgi:sodium transport system permease protein